MVVVKPLISIGDLLSVTGRHREASGMELVPSSANMKRSVDAESDTDFSLISSLTSEQHAPSASRRSRASLLVSTTNRSISTAVFYLRLDLQFPVMPLTRVK